MEILADNEDFLTDKLSGGEFAENIDRAGGAGSAKFVERAIAIYCK